MSKTKLTFACQSCGALFPKWMGQCTDCGAWNSVAEEVVIAKPSRFAGYAAAPAAVTRMADVTIENEARLPTGLSELDRVLGGI